MCFYPERARSEGRERERKVARQPDKTGGNQAVHSGYQKHGMGEAITAQG